MLIDVNAIPKEFRGLRDVANHHNLYMTNNAFDREDRESLPKALENDGYDIKRFSQLTKRDMKFLEGRIAYWRG